MRLFSSQNIKEIGEFKQTSVDVSVLKTVHTILLNIYNFWNIWSSKSYGKTKIYRETIGSDDIPVVSTCLWYFKKKSKANKDKR